MEDNLNKPAGLRGLSTIGASYIIAQIIYGVFWFSIAPILGKQEYGEVSYFIAIANIASTIAFIGAGNTILVYTPKKANLEPAIFSVTIISSIITSVILFVILQSIETSLFVIGFALFGLSINEILARKHYKKYAKYLITQRVIQVALSLLFYFVMGPMGIVLGFAASYFVYANRIIPILKKEKNFALLRPKIGFMSNSYLVDLSRTFSIYTDKLIVLPIFGFALLGSYQLGIQYLTILSILPNIVFQYVLPQDATGTANIKLKTLTIITAAILAVVSMFLIPIFFPMLFPEFNETVPIIQVLSIAIIPKTISMMLMSNFMGTEKSRIVSIGSGIYLSLQIAGIVILGDMMGIVGVAWALLVAASAEAVFLAVVKYRSQ